MDKTREEVVKFFPCAARVKADEAMRSYEPTACNCTAVYIYLKPNDLFHRYLTQLYYSFVSEREKCIVCSIAEVEASNCEFEYTKRFSVQLQYTINTNEVYKWLLNLYFSWFFLRLFIPGDNYSVFDLRPQTIFVMFSRSTQLMGKQTSAVY